MATRKRKLFWAWIVGTGVNEKILIAAHEVISYQASTYHKFTYPNGVYQLKNDFGVSAITIAPVELSEDEIEKYTTNV